MSKSFLLLKVKTVCSFDYFRQLRHTVIFLNLISNLKKQLCI